MPPAVFYPLTVSAVDRLTADAAALTFAVPPDLRETFAFRPGQSLTVRRGDERRSYSICVPPGRAPRIGVREVPDGCVSGWLVRGTRPGDTIEVQPPSGAVHPGPGGGGAARADRGRFRHHAGAVDRRGAAGGRV